MSELAAAPVRTHWTSSLLSGRGIAGFWILYGAIHAAYRLHLSPTLALDDARASELVQSLELGYQARQPPLYEWLLWGSQQLFGSGLLSHILLRYALIALLGYSVFAATRLAVRDERWAAVASLSLVASYPVGWLFHEAMTQSILLSIACFVTLAAGIRYLQEPSWRTSARLGVAIGFGLLTKFSYPVLLGGLLLAVLSLRETRARLANRYLLLAAAIATAMILPFVAWLFAVRGSVAGAVAFAMIQTMQPHWLRALIGLGKLLGSLPLFLLPWIIFIALLVPGAFRRAGATAPAAGLPERIAGRTLIFAVLLAMAGIAAIGATNIAERYMHAILIVAPVYVFARVARLAPGEDRIRRFAVFFVGAAIVVLGVRFLVYVDTGVTQRADRHVLINYEALARALAERGLASGTAVAVTIRDAGNVRAFLPDLRVVSPDSFRLVRPARRPVDDQSCILIWEAGWEPGARQIAPIDTLPQERFEAQSAPSILGRPRRDVWVVARLDPASPACR
ncbi:MAG: ArnT family glycosyltransferase [Xanthobacteraceae bacterium]